MTGEAPPDRVESVPSALASHRPSRTRLWIGLYLAVGGAVSIAGWVTDLRRLTDWFDTGISIQPNAALAVMVSGLALLALQSGQPRAARALGLLVGALGGIPLFEWIAGLDLPFDAPLVFGRMWGREGVLYPGRMGPPGALSLTLIGCGLAMASAPGSSRSRRVVPVVALLTMGIASLSLIGYLYGANALYSLPTATAIAFQTSTFILAAALGLILAVPERGPMPLLEDAGPAGMLVRRILPAIILVPIAFGMVRLAGERAGAFDVAFGTAIRSIGEIALLLALLWWAATVIRRQSQALRESQLRLESELADSQQLQRLSAVIVQENPDSLYETVVDAALTITRAHGSKMQMLQQSERGEPDRLRLIAARGLGPRAEAFWSWVGPQSPSSSGQAMVTGARVVVADVTKCAALEGTEDLDVYLDSGIRAVQSTPLLSRTGKLLGVLSTHWDHPHEPSAHELGAIDVVARQAADLIERRQNEEALRLADRRKDEFLMTLAHELRNPLAPLRSAVDLMKRKDLADPDLQYARGLIDRQVTLMARLLDDLLDVGRIARDQLGLQRQRVDLQTVIRGALEQNATLIEGFKHELHVDLPPGPVVLDGDPVRLGQIFGNLLNNASRYTEPGGHIWVTARLEDQTAVVTVRDSGIGIPRDKLSSIFGIFSQVDRSFERAQGGLGIGLHLVKRLVALHGGVIEARSDGEGLGSVFTVRLPADLVGDVAPAEALAVEGPAPERRLKILVVDDNVDAASALTMLLELDGHDVRSAHDGVEALEAAESFRPDVILLDVGLPGMNGLDVCRHIRAQAWGQVIVIVALTGWSQAMDRRMSQEAGFDYHVVKPAKHGELRELLARRSRPAEPVAPPPR